MNQIPQVASDERSLDKVLNAPDRYHPVGFILRLAKALHTYGVPAYELERTLAACASRLGFGVQCLSLPTSITMTLMKSENDSQTYVIRVAPGEVHLEKLRRVSEVAHQVMLGELTPLEGADQLSEINRAAPLYSSWLVALAFALISGSVARIFGGSWYDILTSFVIGTCLGILSILSFRFHLLSHLLPAVAALSSTVIAYTFAQFYPIEIYICIVSGLIILLPGFTLTIAMAELATQNLMSGTSRLFGAGIVFILMAFGMVIGNQISELVFTNTIENNNIYLFPLWSNWIAVFMGSCALVVLFQAKLKYAGWVILGGLVAYTTVKFSSYYFNSAMTAFLGAITIGAMANLVARFREIPGATMLVPGFIMLVPGSVGFKSLTALVEHDVVAGLDTAFNMTIVGISLVAGLLISSLVTLPKSSELNDF